MLTPAEIDRMARSGDPDTLEVAADACEEAGDARRADGLRWRAVLGRLPGAIRAAVRETGISQIGLRCGRLTVTASLPVTTVSVMVDGQNGWLHCLTGGGSWRRARVRAGSSWEPCRAPRSAAAVLAALRAALAERA